MKQKIKSGVLLLFCVSLLSSCSSTTGGYNTKVVSGDKIEAEIKSEVTQLHSETLKTLKLGELPDRKRDYRRTSSRRHGA